MTSPTSVLSKTLQSITLTKIREIEKQRITYEARKNEILSEANDQHRYKRISTLLQGVKELYPAALEDGSIMNISRWLKQSHYDASIPTSMLKSFEDDLRSKLEVQTKKLEMADLCSRLLTEWMNPSTSSQDGDSVTRDETPEDSFEVVERQKQRLQELCDKFESVVFEPLETNETEIHEFMADLFSGEESCKALQNFRETIKDKSDELLSEKEPFNPESLTNCIKGLLTEDLLSDEKQSTLQDILQNQVVLAEMADVLNMRYADIKNWDWHAGPEGIPVMPRQQLNGKYRIWMDEDVLHTIFLQYISIRFCMMLKSSLKLLIKDNHVWDWETSPKETKNDTKKLTYHLNWHSKIPNTVEVQRREDYLDTFFLCQLPETEISLQTGGGYDDDNASEENEYDEKDGKKSSIKQKLLRKMATEVLFHRCLRGEVAVVQSDLQWYATALPHNTIFAVMRFFGFPNDWIIFFKKYLEPPLNIDHSSEDRAPTGPRIRKRGVPMAHASEKFLGELILFVMDLTVNKKAQMLLYRLHDDLWLCGPPEKCANAWSAMQTFSKVMGLDYNMNKTGSVYLTQEGRSPNDKITSTLPKGQVSIGFLKLDQSGDWVIDQKSVDAHINQLQKQLSSCDSVLSWVQTWNSCIGRFFGNTFGEPAFCFGKKHVDNILGTYKRMQDVLFNGHEDSGKSVTEHLRYIIQSRFDVSHIADAFFFLPEQLGGLGLRNPFVTLFLIRDKLGKDPETRVGEFLAKEKEDFYKAKKGFDGLSELERRQRLNRVYAHDVKSVESAIQDAAFATFISFDEYSRFRESRDPNLYHLYNKLMGVPTPIGIQMTREVESELRALSGQIEPQMLDAEKKWVLQMFAPDLFARYGGLSLVEKRFLPMGVLTMMRQKKVSWRMVL